MIHTLFPLAAALDAADFTPDWESARGIFCGVAWCSTIIAALLTIFSIFAGVEADADGDLTATQTDTGDGDAGLFSLRAIVGFFLGMGWGGFIAASAGMNMWGSAACALAAGLAMFFTVAFIMRAIYSLKSEVVFRADSLIGKTGTVYVTIPPKGEPGGQVQVSAEQLITMPAVQEEDTPLPAQTPIIVTAATPNQLTVKALR